MIFWPKHARGIAEADGEELLGWGVDLDHGDVVRGVRADDLRPVGRAVEERDADGVGVLDDVEVGQDMPLLVEDEARARAGGGLVAEEALALRLGGDVDDALVHVGVDEDVVPLLGVEVLEHVVGRGGSSHDRGLDRRDGPRRVGLDRHGLWGLLVGLFQHRDLNHRRLATESQAAAEE